MGPSSHERCYDAATRCNDTAQTTLTVTQVGQVISLWQGNHSTTKLQRARQRFIYSATNV